MPRHAPTWPSKWKRISLATGPMPPPATCRLRNNFLLDLFYGDVAHILTLYQEDDVFRHILGVIANAFDGFGSKQHFNGVGNGARVFHHECDELAQNAAERLIHVLIVAQHLHGAVGV